MNTYIHVCIFHKASLKIRQKKSWLRSSLYEIFLYLNNFVLNHYTHKAFEFVHIYKAPAPADIFDLNLFTKDILKKMGFTFYAICCAAFTNSFLWCNSKISTSFNFKIVS